MDSKEFRVLIKHCFLCGRTGTEDAARSGRPNEAVVPENIKKIHRIILNDRKVKVRELAEAVSISKGSVGTILHEHLGVKKLVGRWVPRFLTINQKQQRIMDSEHCLELFRRNPSEFLRRFITMDETWIHHYTPQSNKQSAEWLEAGQSRPKRPKTQQSAGKVLASIFWDACGVIFIDYLEKGKTVTGEYYASLLDHLNGETTKKRPHLAKKKCCSTKTMHRLTNQRLSWQNSTNCFPIHRILQIWPPATIGCFQT